VPSFAIEPGVANRFVGCQPSLYDESHYERLGTRRRRVGGEEETRIGGVQKVQRKRWRGAED
jgi:hypothetical protein